MKWFQKLNIHMYMYTLKIWKPDSFYGDKIGGNLLHVNFPITRFLCKYFNKWLKKFTCKCQGLFKMLEFKEVKKLPD